MSWWDHAHWFDIDSLQASVCVDINRWQDYAHLFDIDS